MKSLSRTFFCFVCGILLAMLAMSALLTLASGTASSAYAQADELVQISVEGLSRADSAAEASREISQWAMANTAREQAIELIGSERYQKSKAAVESKIVRLASRFIPYMNPGEPVKQTDGSWKMPVELKVSTASLRRMVLEAGLLSDAEGPAAILPLITFTDRAKGISLRWWMGEEKDEAHQGLSNLSRLLHEKMQTEFIRQGFYMMSPLGLQTSPLPTSLRTERPTQNELVSIANHFKMSMVARGDVRVMPSRSSSGAFEISAKIQVLQTASGRAIAEVSRQFTTEAAASPAQTNAVIRAKAATELPELAKDLAAQVLDAWQRGTLNTNTIKITVRGTLSPKQMTEFKAGLLKSAREVKNLKDRLFDRQAVTFEADVSGEAAGLGERLKTLQIPGFQTKLANASAREVTLDVRAR